MLKKSVMAFAAGALLAASSTATAQSVPMTAAPEPAVEIAGAAGENRLMGRNVATTLGVMFGIFVLVIFIWGNEGNDDPADVTPVSP